MPAAHLADRIPGSFLHAHSRHLDIDFGNHRNRICGVVMLIAGIVGIAILGMTIFPARAPCLIASRIS